MSAGQSTLTTEPTQDVYKLSNPKPLGIAGLLTASDDRNIVMV